MSASIIEAQINMWFATLRQIEQKDPSWKTLILDSDSERLISSVLDPKKDFMPEGNITHIQQITDKRAPERDNNVIYILTPKPHIVECLMSDFKKRKYRGAYLVWTSLLHPKFRNLLDKSPEARSQILLFKVLNVEFFPHESHLTTFRDPASFYYLFHPACNNYVKIHLQDVAQKIVGVCVALGEYPTIRYYSPTTARHEAKILCEFLALYVQEELDLYAKFHDDFPAPLPTGIQRQRAVLYIVDRSLDLFAPILHELTFQAMVFDLLPIAETEDGRHTYTTRIKEGTAKPEDVTFEITVKDTIWADARHLDMERTSQLLTKGLRKFRDDNPELAGDNQTASLNAVKNMMAGLESYGTGQAGYTLNISLQENCFAEFKRRNLFDPVYIEQTLAIGLDDQYKPPKGLAEQIVRALDEEGLNPLDRKRLLMLYALFKDGIIPSDTHRLLAHAKLSPQDVEAIENMALLGARPARNLKDPKSSPMRLFKKQPPPPDSEENTLSRFEPALKGMLEAHAANRLDPEVFKYVKPPLDVDDVPHATVSSLRQKQFEGTWAKGGKSTARVPDTRQRVVVFMAGGATYSEARTCYEVGRATAREIYLVTSHMLTPASYVEQLQNLSGDRRRLRLPADQPTPEPPRHIYEPDPQPKPQPVAGSQPPTVAMSNMNLGNAPSHPPPSAAVKGPAPANSSAKLSKEPQEKEKEKKKKGLLGFGKKS